MDFNKTKAFVCARNNIGGTWACDCCDKTTEQGATISVCGKCHYSSYCSKECQNKAWQNIHKVVCPIYVNFDPIKLTNEILEKEEVKKALNIYSRYSPRITDKFNNIPRFIYFHLICINTFYDEFRYGIFTILKLAPPKYAKDLIKEFKVLGISENRPQDLFHLKISFYHREHISFNQGRYYFLDRVEKVAYIPEATDDNAITDLDEI